MRNCTANRNRNTPENRNNNLGCRPAKVSYCQIVGVSCTTHPDAEPAVLTFSKQETTDPLFLRADSFGVG